MFSCCQFESIDNLINVFWVIFSVFKIRNFKKLAYSYYDIVYIKKFIINHIYIYIYTGIDFEDL